MNPKLIQIITEQFQFNRESIHGTHHWRRVEELGLMLADQTGADRDVVSLFAYLHDSKRENELVDPEHSARAADFAEELYQAGNLALSEKQLEQLVHACRCHSDPNAKSDDMTVMTCWDADRLDLWRVGETPDPARLNTDAARDPSMIEYSCEISSP
jgi:uncharacterized protein